MKKILLICFLSTMSMAFMEKETVENSTLVAPSSILPCEETTFPNGSVLTDCGRFGATLWESPLPGGECGGVATTCATTVIEK